jgi:hypothetical protein
MGYSLGIKCLDCDYIDNFGLGVGFMLSMAFGQNKEFRR